MFIISNAMQTLRIVQIISYEQVQNVIHSIQNTIKLSNNRTSLNVFLIKIILEKSINFNTIPQFRKSYMYSVLTNQ